MKTKRLADLTATLQLNRGTFYHCREWLPSMHICILGGAGTIGATTAYTLSLTRPDWHLSLVDPSHAPATGHARDIETALAHAAHPVGAPLTPATLPSSATVTAYPSLTELAAAYSPTELAADSADQLSTEAPDETEPAPSPPDVFVVAASVPRPDGAASRGERQSFLARNRDVIDDIAGDLAPFPPTPVILVSNPVDQLTYRLWKQTPDTWTRDKFIGYSLSETARTAWVIARRRDVSPAAVTCPVMGEHGENMVPVFSRAQIHGEPVGFTEEAQTVIRDTVRDLPYDIIRQRGEAETSRWVTGRGAALLASALGENSDHRPICVSTPLAGEYGYQHVALSVPVTLTGDGITEIHHWELSDRERTQLDAAYDAVAADTTPPDTA